MTEPEKRWTIRKGIGNGTWQVASVRGPEADDVEVVPASALEECSLTSRQRGNLAFVIGRLEGYADGLDVRAFQYKREEADFARTLRAEAATIQRVLDGSDEEPTGFPRLLQSDREEAGR